MRERSAKIDIMRGVERYTSVERGKEKECKRGEGVTESWTESWTEGKREREREMN